MTTTTRTTLLLCDLAPFRYSTRTRKIAAMVAPGRPGEIRAITLARVGRLGMSDSPGRTEIDGVEVEQLPVSEIDDRRNLTASVRNLLLGYLPALWRLRRRVLSTPARTILVGHVALFWLGIRHRRRWGSEVIISSRELPGGIRTKGSLATWFSRLEPWMIRRAARRHAFTVVAVCDSHAARFGELGVKDVLVVRNVPLASFAPDFTPPPEGPALRVACVGSLYPGRGVEVLIDAVVAARTAGAPVQLTITGPAGREYRQTLRERIDAAEAGAYIALEEACAADQVAACYQRAHVGTALYEAVDAANDSLSNKIFEGVVAGRPVIAGNLAENRALVARHRLGWTCPVEVGPIRDILIDLAADLPAVRAHAQHCHHVGRTEFVWEIETLPLQKRLIGT
ncbi:glycosyltransferase [Micromonospora sp. NPDC051006]|uniref:glycosyltransferase n=1 Tax=Micromonospora sp. NPDC051006 TaxID=3364283 RepID=UPI0037A00B1A